MSKIKVEDEAFVIHTRQYKESSLLVELFSRNYGRISVVAKGARRNKSALKVVLIPFQLLTIEWLSYADGKSDLGTLTKCEASRRAFQLQAQALIVGLYMNELLMNLLIRHDAHPALFDRYLTTLEQLCSDQNIECTLRVFEKNLLAEIGYALECTVESDGHTPIDEFSIYVYEFDKGARPVRHVAEKDILTVQGATLKAIKNESFNDNTTLLEAKRLLRFAINQCLGNKQLYSRTLFRQKIK